MQTSKQQAGEQQEPITSTTSPITSTHGDLPLSFLEERDGASTRSLQDLYEVIKRLDNLTLFCLFDNYEPINFQETAQDEK